LIDEHLQGVIGIYRDNQQPFSRDEINSLDMIANELAMLIYVDHQRRQALSFSERKKLVRDLHDTVTQQIYGLLYQVEIAQAQAEREKFEELPASLVKIGDSARQALREMRLFMHELQPVDLKEEGLVSALHRRLTSVEGRANLQMRFIAPDSLQLSNQQELVLYQIAREALNNVLRHSRARHVTVNLKQGRRLTCLEVHDDGIGFDTGALSDSGGMGVKNMREWARQGHARLRIRSGPGKGTIIKVLVPHQP
jgi:signal transduction histidine kinase